MERKPKSQTNLAQIPFRPLVSSLNVTTVFTVDRLSAASASKPIVARAIDFSMTCLVTRHKLARVTQLIHRHQCSHSTTSAQTILSFTRFRKFSTSPNPETADSTAIVGCRKIRHLRPLMDAQQPESGTPAVEGEDFVHVENPDIMESLVGTDDPKNVPASSSRNAEASENPKVLPEELSRSVVTLTCESTAEGGVCDVYVVGTAHVSEESCREVQAIINFLKPQVVFLELCSSRVTVLTPQNLKVPTMREMIGMLKKKHNVFAVLYSWFLAKVASKLDVFPGSEFRVAYEEALKYGGRVILGDRPVQITIMRTWRKMSFWHKTKLVYSLLFQAVFLPNPDALNNMLKEMDDIDMLTLVIQEMSKQFPTLMETLVHERDQYMAATLLKVASESNSVVAVVGKGHLQGIKKHWKEPVVVRDLMTIPSLKPGISAVRTLTSIGVAVAGIAIISGIYISSKK